jgi:hypothetical protein
MVLHLHADEIHVPPALPHFEMDSAEHYTRSPHVILTLMTCMRDNSAEDGGHLDLRKTSLPTGARHGRGSMPLGDAASLKALMARR